jgi:hypothetical protein
MNHQHLLRDSLLYPLLALRTVWIVETWYFFASTTTKRGWAATVGLFSAGVAALALDRSFEAVLKHGWHPWMMWAAVYGAGLFVTLVLILLFEAIG